MTRPRFLFAKSQATQKNIAPVPHDKFKYSQCVYTAPRTLIKCKELRTKEQMSNSRGLCEQHNNLAKICAKQFTVETELLKLEVDGKPHVKYEKALRLGNQIVDPEFLTEKSHWRGETADSNNVASLQTDHTLNDNILSHSSHVSEKELMRSQLARLISRSLKLKEMRERNEKKAKQRMLKLGVDGDKIISDIGSGASRRLDDDPTMNSILTGHENFIKMDAALTDKISAIRERKTNLSACSFLLDGVDKKCTENALPNSQLCRQHILMSTTQKLFTHCKICRAPCIDLGVESTCDEHRNPMKDVISPGGSSHVYRIPSKKAAPAWHSIDGMTAITSNEIVMDGQSLLEEDDSNIAPITQRSTNARKKTWDGAKTGPIYNPMPFMAAMMGTNPTLQTTNSKRKIVNESQTMSCARVREFSAVEFEKFKPAHVRMQQQARYSKMQQEQGYIQGRDEMQSMAASTSFSSFSHPTLPSHARAKPYDRPKLNHPYTSGDGESKESLGLSRVFLPPPLPSTVSQDVHPNLYAKPPAYIKKEQDRRLPPPSTRLPPNRTSFPLGKAAAATQYARTLGPNESQQSSSSTGLPSGPPRGGMHSSTASSIPWNRPSHLPSPRPPPPHKTLPPRGSTVPSQPVWTAHSPVKFKAVPVGGRTTGGAQLPVRQALTDENKSLVGRPSQEMPRMADSSLPSTSHTSTKTISNTSLPTLSRKDDEETPITSPFSTPPQLSLEKAQMSVSKEDSSSEGVKSEGRVEGRHVPFDQQIDDIEEEEGEEEDEYEVEL